MNKKINIKNKKAKFDYYIKSKFTAGIVLSGTEIKSIRDNKASISESYCEFSENNELFIVNMNIELYRHGNNFNHKPKAKRKLLLNKKELSKIFFPEALFIVSLEKIFIFLFGNNISTSSAIFSTPGPLKINSQLSFFLHFLFKLEL